MTARHDQLGVLGAALAQWTDRANATDRAAARRAGGTAVGAIDAMLRQLDLLRGQVTREIPRPAKPCADQQSMERPAGYSWRGALPGLMGSEGNVA